MESGLLAQAMLLWSDKRPPNTHRIAYWYGPEPAQLCLMDGTPAFIGPHVLNDGCIYYVYLKKPWEWLYK